MERNRAGMKEILFVLDIPGFFFKLTLFYSLNVIINKRPAGLYGHLQYNQRNIRLADLNCIRNIV